MFCCLKRESQKLVLANQKQIKLPKIKLPQNFRTTITPESVKKYAGSGVRVKKLVLMVVSGFPSIKGNIII